MFPQIKLTMTIEEATMPCDMANPALRMAKILKAPPGTQNSPITRRGFRVSDTGGATCDLRTDLITIAAIVLFLAFQESSALELCGPRTGHDAPRGKGDFLPQQHHEPTGQTAAEYRAGQDGGEATGHEDNVSGEQTQMRRATHAALTST